MFERTTIVLRPLQSRSKHVFSRVDIFLWSVIVVENGGAMDTKSAGAALSPTTSFCIAEAIPISIYYNLLPGRTYPPTLITYRLS